MVGYLVVKLFPLNSRSDKCIIERDHGIKSGTAAADCQEGIDTH